MTGLGSEVFDQVGMAQHVMSFEKLDRKKLLRLLFVTLLFHSGNHFPRKGQTWQSVG
ncbi:MAG: hypothetical protein WAO76_11145 [Georgfuchsia sp.]